MTIEAIRAQLEDVRKEKAKLHEKARYMPLLYANLKRTEESLQSIARNYLRSKKYLYKHLPFDAAITDRIAELARERTQTEIVTELMDLCIA